MPRNRSWFVGWTGVETDARTGNTVLLHLLNNTIVQQHTVRAHDNKKPGIRGIL